MVRATLILQWILIKTVKPLNSQKTPPFRPYGRVLAVYYEYLGKWPWFNRTALTVRLTLSDYWPLLWLRCYAICLVANIMMTSWNGNILRVTGPLCGEFTGPGEFPAQRPVTRSFDVFFDLRLHKRLSKQPRGWCFETPAWSLWPVGWPLIRDYPGDTWHRNNVIITSNDVATTFWRNNDVIITSCVFRNNRPLPAKNHDTTSGDILHACCYAVYMILHFSEIS